MTDNYVFKPIVKISSETYNFFPEIQIKHKAVRSNNTPVSIIGPFTPFVDPYEQGFCVRDAIKASLH